MRTARPQRYFRSGLVVAALYERRPACSGGHRPPLQALLSNGGFRLASILRLSVTVFLAGLALLAGGCGNSAQERAYARAEQLERQSTTESAPAVIAEYRRVIALEPGSSWAKKAAARIQAVEARRQAEETRKEVFQEHGVD